MYRFERRRRRLSERALTFPGAAGRAGRVHLPRYAPLGVSDFLQTAAAAAAAEKPCSGGVDRPFPSTFLSAFPGQVSSHVFRVQLRTRGEGSCPLYLGWLTSVRAFRVRVLPLSLSRSHLSGSRPGGVLVKISTTC